MDPEPLGYGMTNGLLAVHAIGMFDATAEIQMQDGKTEMALTVGLAAGVFEGINEFHSVVGADRDQRTRKFLTVIPIDIAGMLIAALREAARINDTLPALTAAVDRAEMTWRNQQ